jgi:ATP-dependent helicase YprA (DUF1998 family)
LVEASLYASEVNVSATAISSNIGSTIQQLHTALSDYIEATYHIGDERLIRQRKRLLDSVGVIHQQPYLESTPRYIAKSTFAEIEGLDEAVLDVFHSVSTAGEQEKVLIYDPPYEHQAAAVEASLVKDRSLVVMTGTGSGKTECFLLPILGKLAMEARHRPESYKNFPAVRALVLYPMNALVNDQLGRLRLLFGDKRIVDWFMKTAGRPARFARYTSRTLYPGVRDAKKDQARLKPIGGYYVAKLIEAAGPPSPQQEAAKLLVNKLRERGKFPAKPDLIKWYGSKGSGWQDRTSGAFKRCVTLPEDPELLTRHEVHEAPPDILVTNYSMLEYMLMRPLERPVFDSTRLWLDQNPDERFLLVIDEAHLYRGAAGAEVALLIRRLRSRLELPPERLQVICTSASFKDEDTARAFGAELSGKAEKDFVTVRGDLQLREPEAVGTQVDAEALNGVDLTKFYNAQTPDEQLRAIDTFLTFRAINRREDVTTALYEALKDFPPMSLLVNLTMQQAIPVHELGERIFSGVKGGVAEAAVTTLMALGSVARRTPSEPGLLPCRIHSFHRGLPGLWVCLDNECSGLLGDEKGGPTGKLYGQPRESCDFCGARVLELYTCRNCGAAYVRAYTDDLREPDFLWSEPGGSFLTSAGDYMSELQALDLLLEEPTDRTGVEPADLDLITGRLKMDRLGNRIRTVYLKKDRTRDFIDDEDGKVDVDGKLGEFKPCGVCLQTGSFNRTTVQDHQTKGDEPFRALIAKQLQVQPPSLGVPFTSFAPLRGRKVLLFADSRQMAARLAPNLQTYSTQDVLRPLIIAGYKFLQTVSSLQSLLSLDDIFLAVLIAANKFGIRLRPELKEHESFNLERVVNDKVAKGAFTRESDLLMLLMEGQKARPPESLLRGIINVISHQYYGLESLALASLREASSVTSDIAAMPDISGFAATSDEKLALARCWIRAWRKQGFWLSQMLPDWATREVRTHTGSFKSIEQMLPDKQARSIFKKEWLPNLQDLLCEPVASKYRLLGSKLTLATEGDWAYCMLCRTTQRPFPGRNTCVNCAKPRLQSIDPLRDVVFRARKGYYRASTEQALGSNVTPLAMIAAEHTAQLNMAQEKDIFSKAEENELLFQDVDLGRGDDNRERAAIDVLSCTTTMEVGIDIGTLSGVALRNMPPGRANYQQRAGRAGRRGNAVATVIAMGSADSHDEHYFTNADEMIRGPVLDPKLTLNNYDITRRHLTAYLLQRYHQARLPDIQPEAQPHLFEVLGTVVQFKSSESPLNLRDFESWLEDERETLKEDLENWLPVQLSATDRNRLIEGLVNETTKLVSEAIGDSTQKNRTDESGIVEVQAEAGEEVPRVETFGETLLDRLLYKGVLPRYAFPTDVATFYVFDQHNSTRYRPAFRFTPSQGLSVALSQYAPGKEVWVASKRFTSGAIYSPMRSDFLQSWELRRLYYECPRCHYAKTTERSAEEKSLDCPACGELGAFSQERKWIRPPGFAHPVFVSEDTSPDDQPARSYATRAKLTAPTPLDEKLWTPLNERVRSHYLRQHLLVTNRGPREEGYNYCTICGVINPSIGTQSIDAAGSHKKPYPDERESSCHGGGTARGIVLGTDFITDVLLISLRAHAPISLRPGLLSTEIAMRTLCEALSKAACLSLDLEAGEIQAEFRPALNGKGSEGLEVEIYLYDTLPGGAGFVRQAGELELRLIEKAQTILNDCPENCDSSCYRCLRSYKNKFDHHLLDRHVAGSLCRFLLTGEVPTITHERAERAAGLLFNDLERHDLGETVIARNASVSALDVGEVIAPILVSRSQTDVRILAITAALTPHYSPDAQLRNVAKSGTPPVTFIDELQVRRNLPRTTSDLIRRLGYN